MCWFLQKIKPIRSSILQAETCQILSLAENPRWSPSVAICSLTVLNSSKYCLNIYGKSYLWPSCKSTNSLKSLEITLPPSTLIIQLLRFSFDVSKNKTRKLHMPLNCPTTVSLKNCGMYQFNLVINHIGESSSSGHYNILLLDLVNKMTLI